MLRIESDAVHLRYLLEYLETGRGEWSVYYPENMRSFTGITSRLAAAYILTGVMDIAGRLDMSGHPPLEPFEREAGLRLPFWFTHHVLEDLLSQFDGPGPVPFDRLSAVVGRTLALPGLRRRLADCFQVLRNGLEWTGKGTEPELEARAEAIRSELRENRFNRWLGAQESVITFDDTAIGKPGVDGAYEKLNDLGLLGTVCLCDFGAPAVCKAAAAYLTSAPGQADPASRLAALVAEGRSRDKLFGKVVVVLADIHKMFGLADYLRSEEEWAKRRNAGLGFDGSDEEALLEFLFGRFEHGTDKAFRHSRFREAEKLDEVVAARLAALFWRSRLPEPDEAAAPAPAEPEARGAISRPDKPAGLALNEVPPPAPAEPEARGAVSRPGKPAGPAAPGGGNAFVIGSLLKRAVDMKMPMEVILHEPGGAELRLLAVLARCDGGRLLLKAEQAFVGPVQVGSRATCHLVAAGKDQKITFYGFESRVLDVSADGAGLTALELVAPSDLTTKRRKGHRFVPPQALVKHMAIWDIRDIRGERIDSLAKARVIAGSGPEGRPNLLDISAGGMRVEVNGAPGGPAIFQPETGQDFCVRIVLTQPRRDVPLDCVLAARVQNVALSRTGLRRKIGFRFIDQAEVRGTGSLRWRPILTDGVWDIANWISHRLLESSQTKLIWKKSPGPS